jgi:hypothetical protein
VVRDIAVFIKIVRISGLMLERWITIYGATITLIQVPLPCLVLNKRFKSDGYTALIKVGRVRMARSDFEGSDSIFRVGG